MRVDKKGMFQRTVRSEAVTCFPFFHTPSEAVVCVFCKAGKSTYCAGFLD